MSRRKIRPAFGTPVSADMSARDLAAIERYFEHRAANRPPWEKR